MEIPTYTRWVIPGAELEERWEYRKFNEYPPGDSDESVIKDFIEDAKEAQEEIAQELIDDGEDEKTALNRACQWPLKDNAPMSAVRNFISYQYSLQEAAKDGVDL